MGESYKIWRIFQFIEIDQVSELIIFGLLRLFMCVKNKQSHAQNKPKH